MRCPFCNEHDTRVVDSRLAGEGDQIRRRRECTACGERFTTYESAELNLPNVVKSDGTREVFLEDKLRTGMIKSLEKRPVASEDIEAAVNRIKHALFAKGEREVPAILIGEFVMDELRKLDHVAYLRFASVYRSFEDVEEFREVIDRLGREPTPEEVRDQIPLLGENSSST
ncbi:MAG: transcriptional regulator NrdR [Pseudomonadota bacterium]